MAVVKAKVSSIKGEKLDEAIVLKAEYNFPETLDEAVKAYGPDVVYTLALARMIVNVQDKLRSYVESGEHTPEQAEELIRDYVIKVGGRRTGDPVKRAEKANIDVTEMSDDQLVASLEAMNFTKDQIEAFLATRA